MKNHDSRLWMLESRAKPQHTILLRIVTAWPYNFDGEICNNYQDSKRCLAAWQERTSMVPTSMMIGGDDVCDN